MGSFAVVDAHMHHHSLCSRCIAYSPGGGRPPRHAHYRYSLLAVHVSEDLRPVTEGTVGRPRVSGRPCYQHSMPCGKPRSLMPR